MSRRYWLPIIVAVGLALASSVCAKPIADHGQDQTRANAKLHGVLQPSPPVTEADIERLASALKTANTEPKSAAEQQQAIENLKAQQAMAAAAQRMFWVGLTEALITLSGVVLVWFTLYHTRRAANAARAAVDEAKRAADVAEESLDEARRIGQAQVRAYVSITEAKINFYRQEDGRIIPHVSIVASNSGQSLARNFVCGMTLQIFYGEPDHLEVKQSKTGGHWDKFPGMSISAAKPFTNVMPAWDCDTRAISGPYSFKYVVQTQVRVDFIYKDIFGSRIAEAAYFSGKVRMDTIDKRIFLTATDLAPEPEMIDWVDHEENKDS